MYNYKKANWQALKQSLRTAVLCDRINNFTDNVSDACTTWTSRIMNIVDTHIPKVRLEIIDSPPWIDNDVLSTSRRKEKLRKKALPKNTPRCMGPL